jgi:hypothetical protein
MESLLQAVGAASSSTSTLLFSRNDACSCWCVVRVGIATLIRRNFVGSRKGWRADKDHAWWWEARWVIGGEDATVLVLCA